MPRNLEHLHQKALIQWARLNSKRYPELALLFAIPNGGGRSKSQAARLKAEGVLAGVSDLMLPAARHGFHGLWIELKTPDGRVSDKQQWWIEQMTTQGYKTVVCWSWTEAREVLIDYLA